MDRALDSTTAATAALCRLLERATDLGPEYGAGLSSHLPMALCALHDMGANAVRLEQFFEKYARRFAQSPLPATSRTMSGDWRSHRGRLGDLGALAGYFRTALSDEGADALLRRVLPDLMSGVGAAAFHGLIRTAYAADSAQRTDLASALAYWACRWLPLPARTADPGGATVHRADRLTADAWTQTLVSTQVAPPPQGRLITDRIQRVVGLDAYAALAGRLVVTADTLARLAAFALDRYLVSRNFTVLHLVTSAHAMRVILPWLEDVEAAVGHYADACAAAYLSCGIAPDAPALPVPDWSWPQVIAKALESDDDHVIKLVHSCRQEMTASANPAYLRAAALAVG